MQASSDKKQLDVGANLFIGNLDENVDERLLYDTFSAFGMMATTAKVRRMTALHMHPVLHFPATRCRDASLWVPHLSSLLLMLHQ